MVVPGRSGPARNDGFDSVNRAFKAMRAAEHRCACERTQRSLPPAHPLGIWPPGRALPQVAALGRQRREERDGSASIAVEEFVRNGERFGGVAAASALAYL